MEPIQTMKIVPGLQPIDTTGATKYSDVVLLKKYDEVCFIVQIGNIAADATLTVQECSNVTPSATTAIAFNYRKSTTTNPGDTFGDLTAATAAGITISNTTDDGFTFLIYVKASQLTADYPGVRVSIAGGAGATLVNIVALATTPRYAYDGMPTAVA